MKLKSQQHRGLDHPRAVKLVNRINDQYDGLISSKGWDFSAPIMDVQDITNIPKSLSGPSRSKV